MLPKTSPNIPPIGPKKAHPIDAPIHFDILISKNLFKDNIILVQLDYIISIDLYI
jgi:hypothetical protein